MNVWFQKKQFQTIKKCHLNHVTVQTDAAIVAMESYLEYIIAQWRGVIKMFTILSCHKLRGQPCSRIYIFYLYARSFFLSAPIYSYANFSFFHDPWHGYCLSNIVKNGEEEEERNQKKSWMNITHSDQGSELLFFFFLLSLFFPLSISVYLCLYEVGAIAGG